MSSGDFNLLHLRNLKMYNPDGSFPAVSSIFTISTNGVPLYTNSIALSGLSASSITTSTLATNTGSFSTLTGSTLTASTVTASTINITSQLSVSSLSASTLTAGSASISTLTGITAVSSLNASTLQATVAGITSLTASTISTNLLTTNDIQLQSTQIALGLSTTSTQTNFSQGSYAASSWLTAKSGLVNPRKLGTSASGQYQLVVSGNTSDIWLSSDSGITWSQLTPASTGLPTLTGSAYWSSGTISANGQYILLSVYGGSLWMSQDYGRTFATTAQPTPDIWLQLNGSLADAMGGAAATATGSPGYVSVQQPGFTEQAINLANTAGGTATQYVRGSWNAADNGAISFWFNTQTLNGQQQIIFDTSMDFAIYISPSSILCFQLISNGTAVAPITSSLTIVANTWYYVTVIFQKNGLFSVYVNNNLIGTYTNVGGYAPYPSSAVFSLGTYDDSTNLAFNGYIADLRIYNSAVPYVPIPLLAPNIWLPFENSTMDCGAQSANAQGSTIYCPFEGSVTDQMGFSTVTATGSPGYVAANRAGYTGQAINLVNTAGSTATQYVRGTWSGAQNVTIAFWMNTQSFTGSNSQVVFGSYSNLLGIQITNTNQLTAYVPSGGGINSVVVGSQSIVLNTWYYITLIFQTNGLCSFYINNSLIGTITNSQGVGSLTTTIFSIGSEVGSASYAFNGYIDDFRLYNYAISYNPVSIMTVAGSLSYVPGVVGLNAVSLANTLDPALATNYIRGTIQSGQTYTLSGWCNFQSLPTSGFSAVAMLGTATTNELGVYFQFGNGLRFLYGNSIIYTQSSVPLNTWFHFHFMNQTNGLSVLHINGIQVASIAITTLNNLPTILSLGCNAPNTGASFNGYIDDFRIYNAAIPFAPTTSTILPPPQNYRSVALSGTAQYALASAASGWVQGSSDYEKTWSKQAVCVGTQGDLIQPNKTGLGAAAWEQNGVNWTATSSPSSTTSAYFAFNNNSLTGNNWLGQLPGQYNTSGVYTGSASTTIQTIGSIGGEWVQIQSSIPLILSSYTYGVGNRPSQPKTMYIIGSTDGSTWYPLQLHVLATNPFTTDFTIASTNITMNITGTQTVIAGTSASLTTTAYSYTTQSFSYFRFIVNTNFLTTVDCAQFGELYLNFTRSVPASHPSALSLSYSGQYQLVATNSAAGSIMPNQTGLAANTWVQGGVQWASSASSIYSVSADSFKLFDNNTTGINTWLSSGTTGLYNSSGVYIGSVSTTIQGGVGAQTGEWVQIQSSVPLVLQSYTYGSGNNAKVLIPKSYYIIGSMDGSNWFPLQFCSMTSKPITTVQTLLTSYITINSTGSITLGSGSGTITSYSTSTSPYMYYRMVINTTWNTSGNDVVEIGELYLNFSNSVSYSSNYGSTWQNTSRSLSNEIVAISPSGQYALSTNCVPPLARLTLDNTNVDAQGVLAPATGAGTVTYSTAVKKVGASSAFFNNTAGAVPSVYLNYTLPAVLNQPSALTMACWVYPTALPSSDNSIPIAFNNSTHTTNAAQQFIIQTTGVVLFNYVTSVTSGNITLPVIAINTWTHYVMTYTGGTCSIYVNGIFNTSVSPGGNLALTTANVIMERLIIGANLSNSNAFAGYVDDVRIYTQALSADEVASLYNNPALTQSIGVSSSYLPIASYTEPVLPGATANVVDAKVSQTGQYMVAVTAANTNNVYYSTDSGSSFNALTIGSSPMSACSVSNDGSYLTVANTAGTVYTLNRNANTFTLALGNQAGQVNQASNAIAIGNQAGQLNQSANSIVLNASGTALNATAPGFYVSPIGATAGLPMELLGYGSDQQVVKSGVTILPGATSNVAQIGIGGNVGIGTTGLQTSRLVIAGSTNQGSSTTGADNSMELMTIMYRNLTPSIQNGTSFGISVGSLSANVNGISRAYFQLGGSPITTNPMIPTVNVMTLTGDGTVGIGTTNPIQGKLHIYDTSTWQTPGLAIENSTVTSAIYQLNVSGSAGWATGGTFGIYNAKASSFSMVISPTGNVGIGVTNPGARLHVAGTFISTSGSSQFTIANSTNPNGQLIFSVNTNGDSYITPIEQSVSASRAFASGIDNTTSLGSASYRWLAVYAGNGTIQTSDSNVKDSEPLPYGINEILQVRTIKYKWKSQANLPDDDPQKNFQYYGFCADELSPLFPELVYDENKEAPVQMNYTELLPVVVNALKEEHASAVALKATVENKAEKITALEANLATTQANLATTQQQLSYKSSQLDALLVWAQAQGFVPSA